MAQTTPAPKPALPLPIPVFRPRVASPPNASPVQGPGATGTAHAMQTAASAKPSGNPLPTQTGLAGSGPSSNPIAASAQAALARALTAGVAAAPAARAATAQLPSVTTGAAPQGQATAPKPKVMCVPTQYKGIVLRKLDNKCLALLRLPGPDNSQDGPWFTLGEFERPADAIATQDCVGMAIYGAKATTIKPPTTYTVEAVTQALLQAYAHGMATSNASTITPLMIINCVQNALAAKVTTSDELFSRAQNLLKTFVNRFIKGIRADGSTAGEAGPARANSGNPEGAPSGNLGPARAPSGNLGQGSQPANGDPAPPSGSGVARQVVPGTAAAAWQRISSQMGRPTPPQAHLSAAANAPVAAQTTAAQANPGLLRAASDAGQHAEPTRVQGQGTATATAAGATPQPMARALSSPTQMQALAQQLAAMQAAAGPGPAQQKLQNLLAVLRSQQAVAADTPLPPGASRQGVGAERPTGVTLVDKGLHVGKWQARHKFFGPKSSPGGNVLCVLTLGHYRTVDEAYSVHDCAALAVPDSFLYRSPSTYTLSQVLSLVRSVTSNPAYTNADHIAKAAQVQALKSRVRHMLPQTMFPAGSAPQPMDRRPSGQAQEGPQPRVTVVLKVVDPGAPSERVHVQLVVVVPAVQPAAVPAPGIVTPIAAPTPGTSAPGPRAQRSAGRPLLKYKPAPRQLTKPNSQEALSALVAALVPSGGSSGPQQAVVQALESAVKQASAYQGVLAGVEEDGVTIKYTAKVPINLSVWAISDHNNPLDAARAHDAAAIGIYGREALSFLNTPPNTFSSSEVLKAMERLATKYAWVRKKHMTHVMECAAECGVATNGAAQPTSPSAQQGARKRKAGPDPSAPSPHSLLNAASRSPGAGQDGQTRSPAPSSHPLSLVPGVPVPVVLDQADKYGNRQPTRDAAAAKATAYTGVCRETSGPMKGTFSAKQSAPTGNKVSPNIYLVVGYYTSAEDAARARDMAALGLQSNPRLNFPADTYTRETISAVCRHMIEGSRNVVARDVDRVVEDNVDKWEQRVKATTGRLPGSPGLQVSLEPWDGVEVRLTGEARVSLQLALVPRVTVRITLPQLAAGAALPAQVPGRVAARPPSPVPVPTYPSNSRLTLNKVLAAKPSSGQSMQPRRQDDGTVQDRRKRRKPNRALDGTSMEGTEDYDMMPSNSGGDKRSGLDSGNASSGGDDDVDMKEDEGPVETAEEKRAAALEAALQAAYDKEVEDHRRAGKRAKGITPSGLGPEDDYFGVAREPPVAGQPAMWLAKVTVTTKEGKTQYLQIGRCEDEETAARMRDLGALSVGNASQPRLNFDADEYTLSEVELLLHSLVEEHPRYLSMGMVRPALRSAEKHGVRNDLATTTRPQAAGRAGAVAVAAAAGTSRLPAAAGALPQQLGWPGVEPVAAAAQVKADPQPVVVAGAPGARERGGKEEKAPAAALPAGVAAAGAAFEGVTAVAVGSKRPGSADDASVVSGRDGGAAVEDHVCARLAVVPMIRLHLLVDPHPSTHRPLIRAPIQVVAGIQLRLTVGTRPVKASRAATHAHAPGNTTPNTNTSIVSAAGPSQGVQGVQGWCVDSLLVLAEAAAAHQEEEEQAVGGEQGTTSAAMMMMGVGEAEDDSASGRRGGVRGIKRGREDRSEDMEGHQDVSLQGSYDYDDDDGDIPVLRLLESGRPLYGGPSNRHHDLVQATERLLLQLGQEDEHVLREAARNVARRRPGLLSPSAVGGGRGTARTLTHSASRPPQAPPPAKRANVAGTRTQQNVIAAPPTRQPAPPAPSRSRSPTVVAPSAAAAASNGGGGGGGMAVHPHHRHVMQGVASSDLAPARSPLPNPTPAGSRKRPRSSTTAATAPLPAPSVRLATPSPAPDLDHASDDSEEPLALVQARLKQQQAKAGGTMRSAPQAGQQLSVLSVPARQRTSLSAQVPPARENPPSGQTTPREAGQPLPSQHQPRALQGGELSTKGHKPLPLAPQRIPHAPAPTKGSPVVTQQPARTLPGANPPAGPQPVRTLPGSGPMRSAPRNILTRPVQMAGKGEKGRATRLASPGSDDGESEEYESDEEGAGGRREGPGAVKVTVTTQGGGGSRGKAAGNPTSYNGQLLQYVMQKSQAARPTITTQAGKQGQAVAGAATQPQRPGQPVQVTTWPAPVVRASMANPVSRAVFTGRDGAAPVPHQEPQQQQQQRAVPAAAAGTNQQQRLVMAGPGGSQQVRMMWSPQGMMMPYQMVMMHPGAASGNQPMNERVQGMQQLGAHAVQHAARAMQQTRDPRLQQ